MDYSEQLSRVSVLGAAGKMGSGILLLTALEMTDLSLKEENKNKFYQLYAIDVSDEALRGLISYLRAQTRKAAEKKIVFLRKLYSERLDIVDNSEIIDQYIEDVVAIVQSSTSLSSAYNSNIVFEAVNENPELKVKLFTDIKNNSENDVWFFTNTSSVPIHSIDEKAQLNGRLIGFHFYNPPAVQKLVEVIKSKHTISDIEEFALNYAKNLRKIVVPSNDIAGFIGNGHFMRDALYGIQTAEKLMKELDFAKSVFAVNAVTQDLLVRPMGIFQLIDYVGIDVVKYILNVMNPYSDEELHSDLLDKLFEKGIKGGQNSDGSQKDGFFKYEKGRISATYDLNTNSYIPGEEITGKVTDFMGSYPANIIKWKDTLRAKNKNQLLEEFFDELNKSESLGGKLAIEYGKKSKLIAEKLVSDGVANSADDVNTVLLTGFFHAYGPINNYFNREA